MTWVRIARNLIGTRELPGAANNPTIMGWGNALGVRVLGIPYTADSIPWCGLFMAWVMVQAGFKPPAIAIRAKEWEKFGDPLPMTMTPPEGAVAVFTRNGGGHVGIVVGIHPNGDLDILGGNQGDAVNIRRFPRTRLTAFRWPKGAPIGKPLKIAKSNTKATTGEA